MEWIIPFDIENWGLNKVTVNVNFYPVEYDGENGVAFIPTGSADKPHGISLLSDDSFLLFFDPNKQGLPFVLPVSLIKNYMKDNTDKIKKSQTIDRDFAYIGYNVQMKDVISFYDESPLVVTSP